MTADQLQYGLIAVVGVGCAGLVVSLWLIERSRARRLAEKVDQLWRDVGVINGRGIDLSSEVEYLQRLAVNPDDQKARNCVKFSMRRRDEIRKEVERQASAVLTRAERDAMGGGS